MLEIAKVPTQETITITKDEYDDLCHYRNDWENMYIIMQKCNEKTALEAIRVLLADWEEPKEIKVLEIM